MDHEPFLMISIVVFIGCAAGVANNALNVAKSYLDKKLKIEELRARNNEAALQESLRHAHEEMGQLRQSTSDVILSFDSTLQRLDDRLQNVERLALKVGIAPSSLPSASATPARVATQSVERLSVTDVETNRVSTDGV